MYIFERHQRPSRSVSSRRHPPASSEYKSALVSTPLSREGLTVVRDHVSRSRDIAYLELRALGVGARAGNLPFDELRCLIAFLLLLPFRRRLRAKHSADVSEPVSEALEAVGDEGRGGDRQSEGR